MYVYESTEDNYWSAERSKMVKTDPKKVPSQIFFLLVPRCTIAQLFTKKNFPLHNPFKNIKQNSRTLAEWKR